MKHDVDLKKKYGPVVG